MNENSIFLVNQEKQFFSGSMFIAILRAVLVSTILGIAVWVLRQILREWRSNAHIAEDAAERMTMIETYSALKETGLIDTNLDPILQALYRSGPTGLIDDSGPVLPIEILMKSAGEAIGRKQ